MNSKLILCSIITFIVLFNLNDETEAVICYSIRNCDGLVYMNRAKYLEPGFSTKNGWTAELDLDRWKNSDRILLIVRSTDFAKIMLDNVADGRLTTLREGVLIQLYKPTQGYGTLKFRVEADPDESYPELKSINVNGMEICPKAKKFGPPIEANDVIDSCDDCGRRLVQHTGLVTHGSTTKEGDWPWHAAIYHVTSSSLSYKCGGTLISPNSVLTAAHCVSETSGFIVASRVIVKLGLYDLILAGRNTQEFRAFKIIPHENFDSDRLRNDIAIIKLPSAVTYNAYVQPACLWPREQTHLDTVLDKGGSVVGWGFNENDQVADTLNQGTMPIVSLTECLASNRDFFGQFLSEKSFCAGYRNGTSVCNGDSGGGMFFETMDHFYVRGIVSLSPARPDRAVCDTSQLVLFTDVAQYLDWIELVLRNSNFDMYK